MENGNYSAGERTRRRLERERQRKKKLIIAAVLAVLTAAAVLCFVLWSQGSEKDPAGSQDDAVSGSHTDDRNQTQDQDQTDDQTQNDGQNQTDDQAQNDDQTQTDDENQEGSDPGSTDTTEDPDPDPAPDPAPEPEDDGAPDRGPEPVPDPKQGSRPWNLVLVNPWNPLPENHSIDLERVYDIYDGWTLDARANADLKAMLDDCAAQDGLEPFVCSSYRTWDTQEYLFNNTLEYYQYSVGMSYEEAKAIAARESAWPGTSEHQLGLAVDIVDVNYQVLNDAQADTPVQQWLMANCWKYGFILRYPADKVDITGIIYEPWHYRYVGREYSQIIHESGLCLEEWLAQN